MNTSNDIFIDLIALIFAVLIGKFVYNWYAEVTKRNRLMEAQLQVDLLHAYKEKISRDALRKIIVDSKIALSTEVVNAMNDMIEQSKPEA